MSTQYLVSALVVLVASFCLMFVYQSGQTTSQVIDLGLQIITEQLGEFQLYLRQQIAQPSEPHIETETVNRTNIVNNYDLSEYEEQCPQHPYTTRIIDRKPLIIYVEHFLTRNEIEHLIELAEPLFNPSKVYDESGVLKSHAYRTSTSAKIKRHQTPVVRCIEQRFAQFQGHIDIQRLEPLHIVKYTPGQQSDSAPSDDSGRVSIAEDKYLPHYDWFWQPEPLKNGGQRVTTFVTYLQANCSKGETEFPNIAFEEHVHKRFCDILMCDEKSSKAGIRFRPIPGNSIFWSNVDNQGRPDERTYHAGRPPGKDGHKIGLNTWTRERPYFDASEK